MGIMAHRREAPPAEFDVPVGDALGTPSSSGDDSLGDAGQSEALETGSGPDSDPALEFRRTLGMFATGVTVITTQMNGQAHGMTVNAFMSVSLQPPLVLISIDHRTRMNKLLRDGVPFGISVLADTQAVLSDHYGGRRRDETAEPSFESIRGTPLVEGALAHLVARVVRSYWGGDHTLFLGQVEYVRYGEGRPLLFHGGRYERIAADPKLFSALAPELLESILTSGRELTFAAGETLMSRGDRADTLMLVTAGSVLVERPGRRLTLGAGALVGEIEVLDPGAGRMATVIAETDASCVVVSREELLAALAGDPSAAIALLEILSSRLREAD
jgi:flavin reductase (DIM6/NTAB) family NADH-FMN oxidoreductase RutF